MRNKSWGLVAIAVFIFPLMAQAAIESDAYLIDQPVFNFGSATTSSVEANLSGTIGTGAFGEGDGTEAQSGAARSAVLPTPPPPLISSLSGSSVRVVADQGNNEDYLVMQVEFSAAAKPDEVFYLDLSGNFVEEAASWQPTAGWLDGVTVDGLKSGVVYQVRSRVRAEDYSVSEWSNFGNAKTGEGLIGGGWLPESLTAPIIKWLQTPAGSVLSQIVDRSVVPIIIATAAVQALAVGSLFGQLLLDLILKLLAAISPLTQYFAFFRRRRPYGEVYDGSSRKMVAGARVTLLRADTKLAVETQSTDSTGRFLFNVDDHQTYLLRVEAPHFDIYEHLWRGAAVNRRVNLGLALEYDARLLRRKQRIDQLTARMNAWRLPLLLIGTMMWLLIYIKDGGFTVWMGAYYLLAWLLELVIHLQPMPYGLITDITNNQPIGGAVIRIFGEKDRLVLTYVTSANGRFITLLKAGVYRLAVSRVGYQTEQRAAVRFSREGSAQPIRIPLRPI